MFGDHDCTTVNQLVCKHEFPSHFSVSLSYLLAETLTLAAQISGSETVPLGPGESFSRPPGLLKAACSVVKNASLPKATSLLLSQ